MATAAAHSREPPGSRCCSRQQPRPVSSTSITTSLRACPMAVALAACSRRLWWPAAFPAPTTIRLRWVAASEQCVRNSYIFSYLNRLAAPSTPTIHFYEIQTRAEGRTSRCSCSRSPLGWDVDRIQSKCPSRSRRCNESQRMEPLNKGKVNRN